MDSSAIAPLFGIEIGHTALQCHLYLQKFCAHWPHCIFLQCHFKGPSTLLAILHLFAMPPMMFRTSCKLNWPYCIAVPPTNWPYRFCGCRKFCHTAVAGAKPNWPYSHGQCHQIGHTVFTVPTQLGKELEMSRLTEGCN